MSPGGVELLSPKITPLPITSVRGAIYREPRGLCPYALKSGFTCYGWAEIMFIHPPGREKREYRKNGKKTRAHPKKRWATKTAQMSSGGVEPPRP
jgi:hypothetical protein